MSGCATFTQNNDIPTNFTDDMSPVKPFKTFVEVNAIDIIVVAFCGYQLMFSWWETDLCESGAGWVSLIECTG